MTKYHYEIVTFVCPVCGSYKKNRERKPGKNPGYLNSHREIERYDMCQELQRGYLLPLINRS